MKIKQKIEKPTNHSYRPDIDGIRAVAIISVLIFHAFPKFLPGGFVGVDIFFVISGFLISSILFKNSQIGNLKLKDFYLHRIKRIFPALILVLSASYFFGWFELLPNEFKQLGKHMAAGAGFVQNIVLLRESGYFDAASELKPLMHLWSLAIEEQFYVFYPLIIWIVCRVRLNLLAVLGALFLLSFGLNIVGTEKNTVFAFFSPHTRFWELLAGGVLAWLQLFKSDEIAALLKSRTNTLKWINKKNNSWNSTLSALGLSLILFSIFCIKDDFAFPGWWALVPVAGTFLLILSGPEAIANRYILANRTMVGIGLISYPLYLWHWPILVFSRVTSTTDPAPILIIFSIFMSFILAWMTYNFVEKPIRFGSKKIIIPTALSIIIIIGFAGFNTWKKMDFHLGKELKI